MDYLDFIRQRYLRYSVTLDDWKSIHCNEANNLTYDDLEAAILNNTIYYEFDQTIKFIKDGIGMLDPATPFHLLFPLNGDDAAHSEHVFIIECLEELKKLNIISVITDETKLADGDNVLFIDDMLFTGHRCNTIIHSLIGDVKLNVYVVCAGAHSTITATLNTHKCKTYRFKIIAASEFRTFARILDKDQWELFRNSYDVLWVAPIVMQHKLPNQHSANLILYEKALRVLPTRVPIDLLTSIIF